jgi:hypothetical protein
MKCSVCEAQFRSKLGFSLKSRLVCKNCGGSVCSSCSRCVSGRQFVCSSASFMILNDLFNVCSCACLAASEPHLSVLRSGRRKMATGQHSIHRRKST